MFKHSEEKPFAEFLARIRAGDAQAAEELVRRFETTIRVAIRARLTDTALQRQLDSVDICQSVFASFFIRAAAGQFDLDSPEQLAKLLAKMAQNKLISQVRKARSAGRDQRREVASGLEQVEVAGSDPSPSRHVAAQELLRRLRENLSEEERQIAELRGQNCSWQEIADRLGGTAEARRKQFTRAIDRLAPDLGLDEGTSHG